MRTLTHSQARIDFTFGRLEYPVPALSLFFHLEIQHTSEVFYLSPLQIGKIRLHYGTFHCLHNIHAAYSEILSYLESVSIEVVRILISILDLAFCILARIVMVLEIFNTLND